MNSGKDIITKKDMAYWLLILVLALIDIVSFKSADNTILLNYISFAGIILSIVLAVIAIIYAFYQNLTNQSAIEKLNDSAHKIHFLTDKLDITTDRMSQTFENIENMQNVIASIPDETSKLVAAYVNVPGINETSIDTPAEVPTEQTVTDTSERVIVEAMLMVVDRMVKDYKRPFTLAFYYYVAKNFRVGKNVIAIDFINRFVNDWLVRKGHAKKGSTHFFTGTFLIQLQLLRALGLIGYTWSLENGSIQMLTIREDFVAEIMKYPEQSMFEELDAIFKDDNVCSA